MSIIYQGLATELIIQNYYNLTSHKNVFLPKTSTCRDGTKPDGNNTTIRQLISGVRAMIN